MALSVPDWAMYAAAKWRERLMLDHWTIVLQLSDAPNGDEGARGLADLAPDYYHVTITLRADIADEGADRAMWERIILHEILHAATGCMAYFVDETLIGELAPGARQLAMKAFRSHYEPMVDSLARSLVKLAPVLTDE